MEISSIFTPTLDLVFRLATIVCICIWHYYWYISEKKADKAKLKTRHISTKIRIIRRMQTISIDAISIIQLFGLYILPFKYDVRFEIIGFTLVLVGFTTGILGRKELDVNWANAHEYQIKKDQELVTGGIYEYIRHPIYAGITARVIGAQIVANSLLFIPLLAIGLIVNYMQARKEEKLLIDHFGNKYVNYMDRTKRFIPFII